MIDVTIGNPVFIKLAHNKEILRCSLQALNAVCLWIIIVQADFDGAVFESVGRMLGIAADKFEAGQKCGRGKFEEDKVPGLRHQAPVERFAFVSSTEGILFVMLDLGHQCGWRVAVGHKQANFAKLFVF